ncbi:MAG: hypothetical protein ACOYM3_31545 [Terrimicrobiaceae bacterium]
MFRLTRAKIIPECRLSPARNTPARQVSDEERRLDMVARFRNSVIWRHPVVVAVSAVFHVCLFAAPILLVAHNMMIAQAGWVALPSVPDWFADLMTIAVLVCAVFFLVRRIALPKVAAISSPVDYCVLLLAVMPFLTGFLAYHQLFDYKTVITLHALAGDLLLIALPFTKVGHMVFFFFSRLTMAGEFCMGRGRRTWAA